MEAYSFAARLARVLAPASSVGDVSSAAAIKQQASRSTLLFEAVSRDILPPSAVLASQTYVVTKRLSFEHVTAVRLDGAPSTLRISHDNDHDFVFSSPLAPLLLRLFHRRMHRWRSDGGAPQSLSMSAPAGSSAPAPAGVLETTASPPRSQPAPPLSKPRPASSLPRNPAGSGGDEIATAAAPASNAGSASLPTGPMRGVRSTRTITTLASISIDNETASSGSSSLLVPFRGASLSKNADTEAIPATTGGSGGDGGTPPDDTRTSGTAQQPFVNARTATALRLLSAGLSAIDYAAIFTNVLLSERGTPEERARRLFMIERLPGLVTETQKLLLSRKAARAGEVSSVPSPGGGDITGGSRSAAVGFRVISVAAPGAPTSTSISGGSSRVRTPSHSWSSSSSTSTLDALSGESRVGGSSTPPVGTASFSRRSPLVTANSAATAASSASSAGMHPSQPKSAHSNEDADDLDVNTAVAGNGGMSRPVPRHNESITGNSSHTKPSSEAPASLHRSNHTSPPIATASSSSGGGGLLSRLLRGSIGRSSTTHTPQTASTAAAAATADSHDSAAAHSLASQGIDDLLHVLHQPVGVSEQQTTVSEPLHTHHGSNFNFNHAGPPANHATASASPPRMSKFGGSFSGGSSSGTTTGRSGSGGKAAALSNSSPTGPRRSFSVRLSDSSGKTAAKPAQQHRQFAPISPDHASVPAVHRHETSSLPLPQQALPQHQQLQLQSQQLQHPPASMPLRPSPSLDMELFDDSSLSQPRIPSDHALLTLRDPRKSFTSTAPAAAAVVAAAPAPAAVASYDLSNTCSVDVEPRPSLQTGAGAAAAPPASDRQASTDCDGVATEEASQCRRADSIDAGDVDRLLSRDNAVALAAASPLSSVSSPDGCPIVRTTSDGSPLGNEGRAVQSTGNEIEVDAGATGIQVEIEQEGPASFGSFTEGDVLMLARLIDDTESSSSGGGGGSVLDPTTAHESAVTATLPSPGSVTTAPPSLPAPLRQQLEASAAAAAVESSSVPQKPLSPRDQVQGRDQVQVQGHGQQKLWLGPTDLPVVAALQRLTRGLADFIINRRGEELLAAVQHASAPQSASSQLSAASAMPPTAASRQNSTGGVGSDLAAAVLWEVGRSFWCTPAFMAAVCPLIITGCGDLEAQAALSAYVKSTSSSSTGSSGALSSSSSSSSAAAAAATHGGQGSSGGGRGGQASSPRVSGVPTWRCVVDAFRLAASPYCSPVDKLSTFVSSARVAHLLHTGATSVFDDGEDNDDETPAEESELDKHRRLVSGGYDPEEDVVDLSAAEVAVAAAAPAASLKPTKRHSKAPSASPFTGDDLLAVFVALVVQTEMGDALAFKQILSAVAATCLDDFYAASNTTSSADTVFGDDTHGDAAGSGGKQKKSASTPLRSLKPQQPSLSPAQLTSKSVACGEVEYLLTAFEAASNHVASLQQHATMLKRQGAQRSLHKVQ